MKRLVVCCDGTWNKPDSASVTNVEKIARSVQTDAGSSHGTQQLVYYVGGVGTGGYQADELLGGAFGFGLLRNVIACYRFLAQNYEPGDEIFVLGFSRGAYTARSVAGMIGKVGLLTKRSLVAERLPEAVGLYQGRPPAHPTTGAGADGLEQFRHDHCHDAPVHFLGVFDTVGALGVPGFMRLAPRFHDVQLSPRVLTARQALAVDEPRLKFAPTFWEAAGSSPAWDERVRQVWFEGAHSDVGGGYPETGLSDTALLWMVTEAHAVGLVLDVPLIGRYVNSRSDTRRHSPLSRMYRVDNALLRARARIRGGGLDDVDQGRRRLTHPNALSLRIASSVVTRFGHDGYHPANLTAYAEATDDFAGVVEPVVALTEDPVDLGFLGTSPAP